LKNILNPQKTATDEVAVMLDTRDPLHVADDLPENVENTAYVNSWRAKETE
jgi:homogentisate 1,2-dioxygenase